MDLMNLMVPITEARGRLFELVRQAADREVILGRYGRPVAVLLSPGRYEMLLEELEDLADRLSVYESEHSPEDLRIEWGKAKAELGL